MLCILKLNPTDHHAAAKIPARSRATKITPTVDEICEHAYQFGFYDAELQRIIAIVTTKTELDQTTVTTLIKYLYPANRVSPEVLISVINCLGKAKKKPSASVQTALVRWVIAVHDVLEDHNILSRFYSTLFNLLDMLSIR